MSNRELWVGARGRVMYARSESAELDKAIAALERGEVGKAKAIIERLRRQAQFGVHKNPPLVVFGNPPIRIGDQPGVFKGGVVVDVISREVHAITYRHAEDGKPYKHDFEHPTLMLAVDRGGSKDVLLTSPDGFPIWQDF